jgi:ABC-type transport system involved in multi-copper enzyme maturation permease subunit
MRKSLFRIEMSRGLSSRGMRLSLLVGLLIALTHIAMIVLPMLAYQDAYLQYPNKMLNPHNVFSKWMGGESYSLQSYLFFLIAPILATLPFADTFFTDRKSGYIKNIYTRVSKRRYLMSKYLAVFLCGGLAVVLPLVVNLGVTAVILPSHLPEIVTSVYTIDATAVLGDLFITQPYLYILIYLLLDFVFYGLLATVALDISFVVENRFVVLLTPFLLYLFLQALTTLTRWQQVNPMVIYHPSQGMTPHSSLPIMLGIIAGLALVTAGIYFARGLHDDTY